MIRRLIETDRQKTMEFVSQKPAENVFIIGDIEGHGFHSTIQTLWGDFNVQGNLRAVLLKYDTSFIIYAPKDFDAKGLANIVNTDSTFSYLSGMEEIVNKLTPYITKQLKKPRVLYYAKCESDELLPSIPSEITLERAQVEDAQAIISLMKAIPEFAAGNYSVENKKVQLGKGLGRAYFIKEQGTIISCASSTAENSQSAMIVGVGTLPQYQKRGLATHCMSMICRELLVENKMLCLFYDNPSAGVIYKRIGFVDIGKWSMWSY